MKHNRSPHAPHRPPPWWSEREKGSPHRRPHWWPEYEKWPPHRAPRSTFFRRLGCFFLLVSLLGLVMLVGLASLALRSLALGDLLAGTREWILPVVIALTFLLMVLLVLGAVNVRRLVTPLDDLLNAADRIGRGDYTVRVPQVGSHQLQSLGRALNQMAERLDETDSRRRDLLADVTHELRTPLTVLQGNLEGMLDGVYPPDEANLKALLEETSLLARLVEDLRTLALAESGALQLKMEPVDLGLLVRETGAAFQAQADGAGVGLVVECDPALPPLMLDPGRIRQVLSNLLSNALRFTPRGGTVAVSSRRSGEGVLLEVRDSGPGIPAQDLPNLFDRFHKSTDSGGMGLGLAIARHLVTAHGGTLTAESAPGEGTTMRVELPYQEERN